MFENKKFGGSDSATNAPAGPVFVLFFPSTVLNVKWINDISPPPEIEKQKFQLKKEK
jgi:hypothetical protein